MQDENSARKYTANKKLQEERLRHNWTQQEVANLVGTTVVNVSRWERGVTTPGPYFRQQLCSLFGKDELALGLQAEEHTSEQENVAESTDEQKNTESVAETDSGKQDALFPVEASQINIDKLAPNMPLRSRRYTRTLVGIVISVLLLTTAIIVIMPLFSSQFAKKDTVHNQITTTPKNATHSQITATPQAILMYSFEDGLTDGWVEKGHIFQFQNSSAIGGYDGRHALQVAFSSRNAGSQPYISVNPLVDGPKSGETLKAAIFVSGTSITVEAQLYVQDMTFNWQKGSFTVLDGNKWNILSFQIPQFKGTGLQIGIQFLSMPYNEPVTIYVDAVELLH